MNVQQVAVGQTIALKRRIGRCPDPLALFDRCCEGGRKPGTLLLETAETSGGVAGKSLLVTRSALRIVCRGQEVEVLAINPNGALLLPWLGERLQTMAQIRVEGARLSCRFNPPAAGSEEQRLKAPSPLDVLRVLLQGPLANVEQSALAPLMAGVMAYDLIDCFETLPANAADPLDWPDFEFWLADRLIWLDPQRGSATILAHLFGAEAQTAFPGDAIAALTQLVEAVEQTATAQEQTPPALAQLPKETSVDLDDRAYAALVEQLQQHIVRGDVFQIVPSRTFVAPCPDALAAYRRLRALNPSPYMFYVTGSRGVLFGASPETALKVEGEPLQVQIRPIAGTRPRGRTAEGALDADWDSRLEAELRLNHKEIAEHMMLVDLARNDIARVSVPGTRHVPELLQVERYSHVMHLVSHVRGELRHDLDALHAYMATMNMGTLVGAPKLKAAALLRQAERNKRGPYGGAVGYLTGDGRMDTALVIRSAVVRDDLAYVRAGAGVVYDSDPMAEAAETCRKAEAVLRAVGQAELDGRGG